MKDGKDMLGMYFPNPILTPEFFHETIQHYRKWGDFHGNVSRFRVLICFFNDVATAVNGTLHHQGLTNGLAELQTSQYPTVLPFLYNWDQELSPFNIVRAYNSTPDLSFSPRFYMMEKLPRNFVYCEVPGNTQISHFAIVTALFRPVEELVWALLFTVVAIISLISWFDQLSPKTDFSFHLLATISATLSPTLGNCVKNKFGNLFICWLVCSIVFNTYLCGTITTNLAVPIPVKTIENIEELHEQNYTLFYNVQKYKQWDLEKALISKSEPLRRLVEDSIVGTNDILNELLGSKLRMAHLTLWYLALYYVQEARRIESIKGERQKKCYAGKKLLSYGSFVLAITPPRNIPVANVFQKYFDAGIYHRWMGEFVALAHSIRVQDRSKILSSGSLRVEVDVEESFHNFNRRLLTIVYLWLICLLGCVLFLIGEIMHDTFYKFEF